MKAKSRKAVYQFYRSIGYSAKEARARRNRTRAAWRDYFSHVSTVRAERRAMPKYSKLKPHIPKPPKIAVNRKAIMEQFKRVGLPAKMRSQLNKLSNRALMEKSIKVEKLKEKSEVMRSFFGIKKDYTDIFEGVENMEQFWKALQEEYQRFEK